MRPDTLVIARHDTCGPWHLFLVRRSIDWCFIHLNVENGMVMIAGSFGAYDHMWSHIGDRHLFDFLAGLDFSYAAEKLEGPAREVDVEATYKDLRADILEGRREGGYNTVKARRMFDALKEWKATTCGDLHSLHEALAGDDPECYELFRYRHSGQIRAFWEQIWRPFVAELYRYKETVAA